MRNFVLLIESMLNGVLSQSIGSIVLSSDSEMWQAIDVHSVRFAHGSTQPPKLTALAPNCERTSIEA